MRTKTKTKRYLTLLEVMLVIALVAIAGGTVFWRLSNLVERQKLEADAARLKSLLLSARMLAMNTKSDWQLELQENKGGGWAVRLVSLEEMGVQIGCGALSKAKLQFTEQVGAKSGEERQARESKEKRSDLVVLQLSATGQVRPLGTLEFHKEKIPIPSFFQQVEGDALGPIHPDDLAREK